MSPVVSEEQDFIVVDRLQSLLDMQDNMRENIQSVKTRLACLEIRMTSIERESHINMHLRRVMLSFAAATAPVLISVMLCQNVPLDQSPVLDFVNAMSKVLLAFAACVGIPLMIQSLSDLLEAQTDHYRTSRLALTHNADGDSDTFQEPEEGGEVSEDEESN